MVRDAVVEEIRDRADLVDVCGEFMPLKRVGKSWRGPCPLHGGDDPNFSIVPDEQIFKCFVCGEGGDVFSFVMKHLGHDFPEAVRWLGDRVGVEVRDRGEEVEDPHAAVREALAFAQEWFRERLASEEGARARAYLEERGLAGEAAGTFDLGYAPDGWRALREAASGRGFDDETLLEAGLTATSEKADEPYDRFRDRLVFPIQDLRDRPLAFGGRDLSGRDEAPKYINSPESPVFRKRTTLYGLNRARHAIRRQGFVLVVEGYTDVVSLHVRGADTAVAPLGTALTREQAETLSRYADTAYLLYDADFGGQRATFRSGDVLLEQGVHPMVATLPPGEDPDSLVRAEGTEALWRYLDDAVDLLDRKLQILEEKGFLDDTQGRRRALDKLLPTLRAASDPALRDLYIGTVRDRLDVAEETLVGEIAREEARARSLMNRRRTTARERVSSMVPARMAGQRVAERDLLLLLYRDDSGSLMETARDAGLEPDHFRDSRYRDVYRGMEEAWRSSREEGGDWTGELAPEVLQRMEEVLEDEPSTRRQFPRPDEAFGDYLARILHREELDRWTRLRRALERPAGFDDDDELREVVSELEEAADRLRSEGLGNLVNVTRKYL
ncbi:MAG: DNA primase [Gemmatimonadota bacterium]